MEIYEVLKQEISEELQSRQIVIENFEKIYGSVYVKIFDPKEKLSIIKQEIICALDLYQVQNNQKLPFTVMVLAQQKDVIHKFASIIFYANRLNNDFTYVKDLIDPSNRKKVLLLRGVGSKKYDELVTFLKELYS